MLPHICFLLFIEAPALAHLFHDFKGILWIQAIVNQGGHDAVAAANHFIDGAGAIADELLCIALPHIRAVRKTGELNKVIKTCGVCLFNHLPGHDRSNLRQADGRTSGCRILRLDADRFGTLKERHDLLVRYGDILHLHPGHVAEHTQHCRIIVSQCVDLKNRVVHGVEVKMSRDDAAVFFVCRILDRRKVIDLTFARDHNNAARMLTRRNFDALNALAQIHGAVFSDIQAVILAIMPYQGNRLFVCIALDGACLKGVIPTEHFFQISMSTGLILAGKVKVDIRLLIALKAQEGRKRDVLAVTFHRRTTFRAVFGRQIKA